MENQTFEFYGTHIDNENSILNNLEEKPKSKLEEVKEKLFENEKNQTDKKLRDEVIIQENGCDQKTLDIKNRENQMVVKSNLLAQKAKLDYTETELKCLNYCISLLKPNTDYINKEIKFRIADLKEFLNVEYGNNDYKLIKNSLQKLHDKSIWIKKVNGEFLFAFLQDIDLEQKNQDGEMIAIITFNKRALQLLQNLKIKYYSYYLYYTTVLKGKYSILFYELCKTFENVGHFIFNLEDIKEKWNIPKSQGAGQIKKQIIDYATKQFEEKTDIKVSINRTFKTKNRKITGYEFKIEKNIESIIRNTDNFREELKKKKKEEKES